MIPKAKGRRRRAAKGIREPVWTYAARDHGPSKANHQRKKKGLYGLMLPKAKDRRRQVAKGIREPIGTYVGRGLGPSKVSHQRHRRSYKDLCFLRSKAIEGDPPKA